jgi:hypothetical protein
MKPSENTAELARELIQPCNYDEDTDTYALPDGWKFLGAGAYRTAILAPDGYVYKVQHNTEGLWQENTTEWEQFHLWGAEVVALSNGMVRLAKCVEFFTDSNVLVMEYEPCAGNVLWYGFGWDEFWCDPSVKEMMAGISKVTDITDIHEGNVYFNTNAEIVIVDYTH